MRIAIVHDFLIEYGGAERVLEVLHEIWPEAPLYTAFYDFKKLGPHAGRFKDWDIRTSWVQRSWLVKKLHSPLRFLTPLVWKYFDFSHFDVVLISSGWYIPRGVALYAFHSRGAKLFHLRGEIACTPWVKSPAFAEVSASRASKPIFICYLHTVPRYLYGYATKLNWQKYWPIRIYGHLVNHFLRLYDFKASQAVDEFIVNSKETAGRVKKFYRRESTVIYPPVEVRRQKLGARERENFLSSNSNLLTPYYLCVSRLAAPKRIDLAILACNELKLPLVVVGKGPEEKYLKSIAGETIKFLGEVPDEELPSIYQKAKALIFPALEEDFGIVPVEAMGYGKPVIALRNGGVMETVADGKTGLFFDKPEVKSLIEAIKRFEQIKDQFRIEDCLNQAQKFSKEIFKEKIKDFLTDKA